MNILLALTRQMGIERRLADLYKQFYRKFLSHPAYNTFWLQMSNEEAGHANLLEILVERLQENMEFDMPELSNILPEQFGRVDDEISRCLLESKSPKLSLQKAFDMAVLLEEGEANILFENILQTLDGSFGRSLLHFVMENMEHKGNVKSVAEMIRDAPGFVEVLVETLPTESGTTSE